MFLTIAVVVYGATDEEQWVAYKVSEESVFKYCVVLMNFIEIRKTLRRNTLPKKSHSDTKFSRITCEKLRLTTKNMRRVKSHGQKELTISPI